MGFSLAILTILSIPFPSLSTTYVGHVPYPMSKVLHPSPTGTSPIIGIFHIPLPLSYTILVSVKFDPYTTIAPCVVKSYH